MPRFGHSSDFSQLFNSNSGDIKDYTLGLIFLGTFTMACFFVWFLVLAILKCFSRGVLGGHRSIDSNQARILCIAFWVATGLSLIFTILLITEGISDVQDTLSTIDNSNQVIFKRFGYFVHQYHCFLHCPRKYPILSQKQKEFLHRYRMSVNYRQTFESR
jgi:hypothetical protein